MPPLLAGIADGIDAVLDSLGASVKQNISDYCDLETADDEYSLVSRDGSLLTVVEIQGVQTLTGTRTLYNNIIEPLCQNLQAQFETKAHRMQIVFEVDHDRTRQEIRDILEPSRQTAERLQLDIEDMLLEREDVMCEWTASERCFMVLWTHPAALTASEQKTEKRLREKAVKGRPRIGRGQNPLNACSMIRNRHGSFVDAMESELRSVGIMTKKLNSHDAVREIRHGLDPGFTSPEWKASLPGDRVNPTQRRQKRSGEEWEVMWPPLSWQICPRDATIVDRNVVEIGERWYSPIYIDLFPRDHMFFGRLFARTMEKRLPWRISFLMEGAGLDGTGFKRVLASLMGWFDPSGGNKMLAKALKDLQAMQQEESESIVKLRVALCTWAPKGEKDILARRVSDLARCVESWGSPQVSEVTGDPLAGVTSASMGISEGSIATPAAAPLDVALSMMPWSRPSSPWQKGAITFRSPDGKLLPYQPYSSMQICWVSLLFAKPGSGKSVLMNMNNLALCLAPGLQRLPRIAIIDVGPSSSGLISLIREALPPNQRHLVFHRQLRMNEESSINPFDTQLGCRYPTAPELAFLRNFLTLLVTDLDEETAGGALPSLVTAVIEEMYRRRSDRADPSRYAAHSSEVVDEAIRQYQIPIDKDTTWWEVVDGLFKVKEIRAAIIAQRFASPLLTEAVTAVQGEKIKQAFSEPRDPKTGESLIKAFSRKITDALSVFPILARPTVLDVGNARIAALDLGEVAQGGGPIGDRITAVTYMLARQVLAKDYYLTDEVVRDMPAPSHMILRPTVPAQAYREYHQERITEIMEDPKRICYDEFHRTKSARQVRDQVLLDMREGRKWKVDIILVSQDLPDFDETMIKFSTGIFVMAGGNSQTIQDISDRFGFQDEAERYALAHRVHGPRRGGGTFLAKFDTTRGWYTMLLSATLGPIELWALSTTADDMKLRRRLEKRLGPKVARRALAIAYPGGSATSDFEERRDQMRNANLTMLTGEEENIIDQVAAEVEDMARRMGLIK